MRWLDGITDSMDMSWSWTGKLVGVGDEEGSLACCSPWGHKESDVTERLHWTEGIFPWSKWVTGWGTNISGWTYQLIGMLPMPQDFQRNPFCICILTSLLVSVSDTTLYHRAAIYLIGQFESQCLASFKGLRVTLQKFTHDETNDWRWKRALNGTGRSDCTVWRRI